MKQELLTQLNWRYATKVFDPNKKLTQEEIEYLLDAIQLSPSSYGLQAWRCLVITDMETRKKLRTVSFNQPQITDSSCLFVFCSKNDIDEKYVENYFHLISQTRNVDLSKLEAFQKTVKSSVVNHTEESKAVWLGKQVYLALGLLLTTCAINGYDACPMEGFQKDQYDTILNLKEKGLASQVLCTVGYRSETDSLSKMKKVRFPKEELFIKI